MRSKSQNRCLISSHGKRVPCTEDQGNGKVHRDPKDHERRRRGFEIVRESRKNMDVQVAQGKGNQSMLESKKREGIFKSVLERSRCADHVLDEARQRVGKDDRREGEEDDEAGQDAAKSVRATHQVAIEVAPTVESLRGRDAVHENLRNPIRTHKRKEKW